MDMVDGLRIAGGQPTQSLACMNCHSRMLWAADEIERLNALIRRCADTIDCLRDYVCEGGSIRMVGAVQSIDDADALLASMAGGAK